MNNRSDHSKSIKTHV